MCTMASPEITADGIRIHIRESQYCHNLVVVLERYRGWPSKATGLILRADNTTLQWVGQLVCRLAEWKSL